MCGLYGFIGKPTKQTRLILRELGYLNEKRGHQSSGFAVIYEKKFTLLKKAVNSSKFWDLKTPNNLLGVGKNCKPCIFMGHARQATTGIISDKNAHPFRIGKFLFCHNGIITNFDELQAKYKTKYEVDSQIIGYLLATQGQKKTFNKRLNGWYTAPFVNLEKPDILKIARHNAPLAFGINSSGIYFTSDIEHLKQVNELLFHKLSICQTKNNTLYTIQNHGPKRITKKDITPPKECTPYYSDFYYSAYNPNQKVPFKAPFNWLPKQDRKFQKKYDYFNRHFGDWDYD